MAIPLPIAHQFLQLGNPSEDNFLITLILFGAIVAFCALIITVVLLVIFFALLAILIGGGLLSTSILVGYKERSTQKGFRFFIVSCCIVLSTIVSVLLFWFLNLVYKYFDTEIAILLGVTTGTLAGYGLGRLMFSAGHKIVTYIGSAIQKTRAN